MYTVGSPRKPALRLVFKESPWERRVTRLRGSSQTHGGQHLRLLSSPPPFPPLPFPSFLLPHHAPRSLPPSFPPASLSTCPGSHPVLGVTHAGAGGAGTWGETHGAWGAPTQPQDSRDDGPSGWRSSDIHLNMWAPPRGSQELPALGGPRWGDPAPGRACPLPGWEGGGFLMWRRRWRRRTGSREPVRDTSRPSA